MRPGSAQALRRPKALGQVMRATHPTDNEADQRVNSITRPLTVMVRL